MDISIFLIILVMLILVFIPVFLRHRSPRYSIDGVYGTKGQVNPGYNNWPKAFLHGFLFPFLHLLKSLFLTVIFVSLTFGLLLFLISLSDF